MRSANYSPTGNTNLPPKDTRASYMSDMDMDNGTLVYEVFILTSQNRIYEVEVNAKTGIIRKIEEENDFD